MDIVAVRDQSVWILCVYCNERLICMDIAVTDQFVQILQ